MLTLAVVNTATWSARAGSSPTAPRVAVFQPGSMNFAGTICGRPIAMSPPGLNPALGPPQPNE